MWHMFNKILILLSMRSDADHGDHNPDAGVAGDGDDGEGQRVQWKGGHLQHSRVYLSPGNSNLHLYPGL